MQYALDSHLAIEHAEEDHTAIQGRHAQAAGWVFAAGLTQRGTADASALVDQLGDKAPGIGPAILGDAVPYVEEVVPRLRRKGDWCDQVARLPLVLVAGLRSGSA